MMRRLALFTLLILAVAAIPAYAQPGLIGPGGLVVSNGASVSISNSSTATTIFTWTIPAGMAQKNYAPLHLKALGYITTNPYSVDTVNVGCNYGGSTATISLVNGVTPTAALSAVPVTLDVWLHGYALTQSNGITGAIYGRFGVMQSAGTETVYTAMANGTTPQGTSNALTCTWKWASASATNSVVFTNGHLVQGE